MNLVVPCEGRFGLFEGKPASTHFSHERHWKRYLEVFESITVISRLEHKEQPMARHVEGPGVRHVALPAYTGPRQYLQKRAEIRRIIETNCPVDSAYILYIPGTIGGVVWDVLHRRQAPYAVEVLGDPYDTMAPGACKHPLRPFFRWWLPRELRKLCKGAMAAAYVTKFALQRRYPCGGREFAASNVSLPDDKVAAAPRPLLERNARKRLIIVGSYNQLYKAPDVLIKAVAECVRAGFDLELELVGEGQLLPELRQLADEQGIKDRVLFAGRVQGGEGIFAKLDAADLFVLPSHQEGLPRAAVEAMARGLPCIGSTVGGFPELFPKEDLVAPGDVGALAAKIQEFVGNPQRMCEASERNLATSLGYRDSVLRKIRHDFFTFVRDETAKRVNHSKRAHVPAHV